MHLCLWPFKKADGRSKREKACLSDAGLLHRLSEGLPLADQHGSGSCDSLLRSDPRIYVAFLWGDLDVAEVLTVVCSLYSGRTDTLFMPTIILIF